VAVLACVIPEDGEMVNLNGTRCARERYGEFTNRRGFVFFAYVMYKVSTSVSLRSLGVVFATGKLDFDRSLRWYTC
jgi:hypothetical protein